MTDRAPQARTQLRINDVILTHVGLCRITRLLPNGVEIRQHDGTDTTMEYFELAEARNVLDGQIDSMSTALQPLWASLSESVKEQTLFRLEVVQELLTGYRDGHPELARKGEPHYPFGAEHGLSETKRAEKMATNLQSEFQGNRIVQRNAAAGLSTLKPPSDSTIRGWVRNWKKDGLVGLIDGRALKEHSNWKTIDPKYLEAAEESFKALDGDRSSVSIGEMHRRIVAELNLRSITYEDPPIKTRKAYLSWMFAVRGKTTRSQKTRALQQFSGNKHYPAMRPGQIIAIDATRADCLVRDSATGDSMSVEILTAIDVATRVIVALRVVPKSADSQDAMLLLYDVCRPFSMLVEGTKVSDWRWCGLPGGIEVPTTSDGKIDIVSDWSTLQGEHVVPSVMPDAVRTDHGSVFASAAFRDGLTSLGFDLLMTRGRRPTDNPHVERWHETLQRGLQQVPGYKGRNPSERGALVANEELLSALELERHLHKFVSLDYHRTVHTGIVLPGDPKARLTPLEAWDVLIEATGRIDVPQRPDLIFDFLPVAWATIQPSGVTINNLVYDSDILSEFRKCPTGTFRNDDAKAPFFRDPHDVGQIWFRDPRTQQIHEIPWRGRDRTEGPLTELIASEGFKRVRRRGGLRAITTETVQAGIASEITQLTDHPEKFDQPARLRAARLRTQQSRHDMAEANIVKVSKDEPGFRNKDDDVSQHTSSDEPLPVLRGRKPW